MYLYELRLSDFIDHSWNVTSVGLLHFLAFRREKSP